MKKVSFLFLFCFLVGGKCCLAQSPWNAKVMLHNIIYGEADTLWIGCDVNGEWGYQPGLDVIDTTLQGPVGIWSDDSLITSGCFNLKKDVKNFVNGIQHFDVQFADYNVPYFPYDYFKIDTNEFKFDNGSYKITYVYVEVLEGGYIYAVDVNAWGIYWGIDTMLIPNPIFYPDSMPLIFENDFYDCIQFDSSQMRIRFEIGFNYYVTTSVSQPEQNAINIFPNPIHDQFELQSHESTEIKTILINSFGEVVRSFSFRNSARIDVSDLPAGLYFIQCSTDKEQILFSEKIIKL